MRNITELVDQQEILSSHPDVEIDTPLYTNLVAACKIANTVRQIIQQSATHPSANAYDDDTYETLCDKIDDMRKVCDRECSSFEDRTNEKQKVLDIWAKLIEKHNVGDCPEYAMLALKKLQTYYPNLVGEICVIANKEGDPDVDAHEFLVIGRDKNSIPHDHKTWGKNAVICDAWLGDVYSAEQLSKRLQCCQAKWISAHRQENNVAPFEPKKHKLEIDFQLADDTKKRKFNSNDESHIDGNKSPSLSKKQNFFSFFNQDETDEMRIIIKMQNDRDSVKYQV